MPIVTYERLVTFVGSDEGTELRRAIAFGTVVIVQDYVDGEHVARIEGSPDLVQKSLRAAGLTT